MATESTNDSSSGEPEPEPDQKTAHAADMMLKQIVERPLPVLTARHPGAYCNHETYAIDERARRVWCRNCRAPLDPVHVLAMVARKFDATAHLYAERTRLRREVEELKVKASRARYAAKKASKSP